MFGIDKKKFILICFQHQILKQLFGKKQSSVMGKGGVLRDGRGEEESQLGHRFREKHLKKKKEKESQESK